MSQHLMLLLVMLIGINFLQGYKISIGFGDGDPSVINIPQNITIGWVFIVFSLFWAIPPWTIARIFRKFRRFLKRCDIEKSKMQDRISEAEK